MGTVIFGGLVVGAAQPFRISCGVIVAIVLFERRSMGILSCFCALDRQPFSAFIDPFALLCTGNSLVLAYYDYLEPLCRNAYMDVALNAKPFSVSAWHVSLVNTEYMDTVSLATKFRA